MLKTSKQSQLSFNGVSLHLHLIGLRYCSQLSRRFILRWNAPELKSRSVLFLLRKANSMHWYSWVQLGDTAAVIDKSHSWVLPLAPSSWRVTTAPVNSIWNAGLWESVPQTLYVQTELVPVPVWSHVCTHLTVTLVCTHMPMHIDRYACKDICTQARRLRRTEQT